MPSNCICILCLILILIFIFDWLYIYWHCFSISSSTLYKNMKHQCKSRYLTQAAWIHTQILKIYREVIREVIFFTEGLYQPGKPQWGCGLLGQNESQVPPSLPSTSRRGRLAAVAAVVTVAIPNDANTNLLPEPHKMLPLIKTGK